MHLETETEIAAPAPVVWSVLADFAGWGIWNSFIPAVDGSPRSGTYARVRIRPPGQRSLSIRVYLTTVEKDRELVWRGQLGSRRVFAGEHYFRIEPLTETSVRFVHGERFEGFLVSLFWRIAGASVRAGFEAYNRGLRTRSEGIFELTRAGLKAP